MHRRTYTLGDAGLVIEHSDGQQAVRIAQLWQRLFVVKDGLPRETDLVSTIRFGELEQGTPCDTGARSVCNASGLRVWKLSTGFRLCMESSVIQINFDDGVARGTLGDGFWRLPVEKQRRFLLLAWVILTHRHGHYALHANGVAEHSGGWLFVGPSGCGKTTLGMQLVRQGWDYLSDDVVLLRRKASAIAAYGVTRGFSCAARNASAATSSQDRVDVPGEDKSILDADMVSAERQSTQCRPAQILFPEIVARRTSRLIPIGQTEALTRLISFSAGIMVDHAKAKSQLDVLGQLVDQASSYRFLAGADVLCEPSRVDRLLRETSEV